MITEINRIAVGRDNCVRFEDTFAMAAPLLMQVQGCRDARLMRCVERAGDYMIQLEWDRMEDHVEHYPATEQAAAVRALLGPLIESAHMAHYQAVVER